MNINIEAAHCVSGLGFIRWDRQLDISLSPNSSGCHQHLYSFFAAAVLWYVWVSILAGFSGPFAQCGVLMKYVYTPMRVNTNAVLPVIYVSSLLHAMYLAFICISMW